jgi:hypothetical protein
MECEMNRLAARAAEVVSGVIAGFAFLAPALAGDVVLKPEEAKRFIADKVFSYSCFDGTTGAGRIHADGSVVGTMQSGGGPVRYVALPVGTIKLGADSICATLPRALLQPCFNVVQTSARSFRGSLRGLGFAYCDFVRRTPRLDVARGEGHAQSAQPPAESSVALRPSRF